MRRILFSIFLTMFLTACGEGFSVEKFGSDISKSEVELTEIEKTTTYLMVQLESDIAALESIDFSELKDAELSLSKLKSIKSSLGLKLDGISDKINELKQKLQEVKQQINDYIAILDPNDPSQRQIIERLQKLLDRVAVLEGALDQVIDLLSAQLNIIDQIFDRLLDRLDPTKPSHILLRFVIEAIRDMIKSKIGF